MQRLRLGDSLAVLVDHRGKTPKKLGAHFVPTGVPVASAILVRDGRIDLREARYISHDVYERWMSQPLEAGDVILTSEAPLGRVARAPDRPIVLGQRLFGLRGRSGVLDTGFLYYALQSEPVQRDLIGRSTGTTVVGIRQSALRDVIIPAPAVAEQRAIAEVLGALDNKIAANASAVRTARGLARALFLSIPTSRRRAETVGSILVLEYGRSLPSTSRKPGPVEVFGSGGLTGYHNSTWLPSRGVIVGRKGTVGAVYWAHGDYLPIDTTFYVVPKLDVSLIYCYHALSEIDLASANSDSAVPGLNRNEAYALPVLVPDESSMSATSDAASALFDAVAGMEHENRLLAGLRDTLLPHLMSGKLRVRDAEKQIEAVI